MPKVKKVVQKKTRRRKKTGSVLDRIAPVSLDNTGIKLNVYGRSGTGKTTFACTFPKPLLIIGSEDGTRSVHNVKGVSFVKLNESQEIAELVPNLTSYNTVVLDAASSLQDMVLKEVMGIEELPAQKSWGMATREQYGQCSLKTKEYLRALLNLECHVVIIAQEREFNTENEGDVLMPFVASALTPSVVGWLNPAVDYICQTFIREQTEEKTIKVKGKQVKRQRATGKMEYCLRTAPDATFTTKFRLPKGTKLPDVIVDADYNKVSKLIKGG